MEWMRILRLFLTSVTVVLLVQGCGGGGGAGTDTATTESSKTDTTKTAAATKRPAEPLLVNVTYDARVGPANVPILMADKKGYFKKLGLELGAGSPYPPSRPVVYISKDTNDFGVTQLPQLLIALEKGAPIIAVGSLVPQPTAAMIWLKKSGIHQIADLKGKTIAIPGIPFQEAFLETVLARAGLTLEDIKVKRVVYDMVSSLLSGKADAIFGGSWNIEGAALKAGGAKPVIKRVQELGIPAYDELIVIVRTDRAAREPQLVRDFMSVVERGTNAVIRDPGAAVGLIEANTESSPESNRKETRAGVEATLPLFSRTGYMDPARTRKLIAWMHAKGLIQRELPVSKVLTNKYLP